MDARHKDGLALIIVISILAVLTIMAISFAFTMRLEVKMAKSYQDGVRARYLAEAAVSHARALLEADKEDASRTRYDYYPDELWSVVFSGDEVDNDEDGEPDSRWIELTDGEGEVMGRYAVLVRDESSKIDINSAGNLPGGEGWTSYETSFKRFLDGVDKGGRKARDHQILADNLLSCRYGSDGSPGTGHDDDGDNVVLSFDGIDNDADGFRDNEAGEGESEGINEPDEFRVEYPYGDDKPFLTPEEIKRVDGIIPIFGKVRGLITVYSKDKEVDIMRGNRWNVNVVQEPQDLYTLFEEAGVKDPGQLLVNILDYKDRDCARSVLDLGDERFYGAEAVRINELMVSPKLEQEAVGAGQIKEGTWIKGDALFKNSTYENPALGEGRWAWSGMPDGRYYLTIYGEPDQYVGKVYVDGTSQIMRHGDRFARSVSVERGSFELSIQHIGIKGITCYFSSVELSQEPDLEFIELVNLSPREVEVGGWTIDGPQSKGWSAVIPKQKTDGSPVVMGPGPWYLVLAVDKYAKNPDPAPEITTIANNGISFEDTWGRYLKDVAKLGLEEACCQLDFSKGLLPTQDLLPDLPKAGDFITLRDRGGHVVDQVEYLADQVWSHRSIEKGDPLYVVDRNLNWANDYWELSRRVLERSFDRIRGTPAMANDNVGMDGGDLKRVNVKNNPFASVGELCEVGSSIRPWGKIGQDVIKRVVDRLTISGMRLEGEAHDLDRGGWDESLRDPPQTHWFVSEAWGDEGRWKWGERDGLINGVYILQVYGSEGAPISVSIHQSREPDHDWFSFPAMTPGVDNGIQVGLVEVGGSDNPFSIHRVRTPDRTLEIRVRNEVVPPADEKAIAHFDCVLLSPLPNIRGRININTASKEVLCSLPGIDEQIAQEFINGRPYGKGSLSFGIGELLEGDILIPDLLDRSEEEKEVEKLARFKVISNLITVASDVYEIIATAQILEEGEVWAEKKLRVVVER